MKSATMKRPRNWTKLKILKSEWSEPEFTCFFGKNGKVIRPILYIPKSMLRDPKALSYCQHIARAVGAGLSFIKKKAERKGKTLKRRA